MPDSQISPTDIYYLEDEDLARQLVELGYRGSGETLKREEFEARKKAAEQARMNKLRAAPKALASRPVLDHVFRVNRKRDAFAGPGTDR